MVYKLKILIFCILVETTGGNVVIVAKNDLTLKQVYARNLSKRYIAENGESSKYVWKR
jgi:hypothetical protein